VKTTRGVMTDFVDICIQASSFARSRSIDNSLSGKNERPGNLTFRQLWKQHLSDEDERLKRTTRITTRRKATGTMKH